ncbi:MAG: GAF domain-containing sensor histidine kinase, partial [Anaerolineae bacterium]|nr:GAF domain-containing sensor histidine kinase [Anaerolineae bacterium]
LANWLRMFMLTQSQPAPSSNAVILQVAGLLCFVLAGTFLLRFATQLIAGTNRRYRWVRWVLPVACVLYAVTVASIFVVPDTLRGDWASAAEVYARYLLLLPGLALATLGLWGEHRDSWRMGLPRIARANLGASLSFGVKAIVSGLVAFPIHGSSQSLPPAAVLAISTARTLASVAIAFFVVRILRALEIERNRQLNVALEQRVLAQQEALAAQRQVHSEVERWARQLEDLVDGVASAMSKATSLEEILDVSLGQVLQLTGFDAGEILLAQEGESELQLITQSGLSEEARECSICLQPGTEALKSLQASRETAVVLNLLEYPSLACSPCLEAGFRCLVSVLVTCRGNLLGIMNLLGKSETMPHANELRMLAAIGQQIGVAIENARLYEQAQTVAALEERERLGREMHDGLAQTLGYLHLKSHTAAGLLSSGQLAAAQAELGEMQEAAREALRDVRGSILGLRTTMTPGTGIMPTLAEYVRRFSQQSGISTELVIGDDAAVEFGPVVEIQLLAIVQEALTNTRKHSRASRASVRLEIDGELAVINIEDDGRGFDPGRIGPDEHYGVHTMRERAEGVGGNLQILTETGHGTSVIARLPFSHRRGS